MHSWGDIPKKRIYITSEDNLYYPAHENNKYVILYFKSTSFGLVVVLRRVREYVHK